MKRRSFLTLAALTFGAAAMSPCLALAKTDFSFLDELSKKATEKTPTGDESRSAAEDSDETEKPAAADTTAVPDTKITFRGIPWGTRQAEVDALMKGEGLHRTDKEWHNIYWPSKISYEYGIRSDISVEDGGIQTNYSDVPVAGSTANATLCFMYPLNEDGALARSDDDARFYLARYSLIFDDPLSAYDDLKNKLDKVYGDVSVLSDGSDEDVKTNTWTDSEGNWVKLALSLDYDKYSTFRTIILIYSASWAENELPLVEDAVEQAKAAAEQSALEAFKNDTTGL